MRFIFFLNRSFVLMLACCANSVTQSEEMGIETSSLEEIKLKSFKVQDMSLRDVIGKINEDVSAFQSVDRPLIELFGLDNDLRVTLELNDIDVSAILELIAEIHDLQILEEERGLVILQPKSLVNSFKTRIYYMDLERYNRILEQDGSFPKFLARMGIEENETNVSVEYKPDLGRLIIRMSAKGHNRLMQNTIRVVPTP